MKYYLLIIYGDVEPALRGPYKFAEGRDRAAKRHRAINGEEDGLYKMNVHRDGRPEAIPYTGGFLDGD